MDLFSKTKPKTDPGKLRQLKFWVHDLLKLDLETSISISQLQCSEANCAPIETVIAVMTEPIQHYKIHKAIAEIAYTDLVQILQSK